MFPTVNLTNDYRATLSDNRISRIKLHSLTLQETGTFREQFMRPYTAVCTEDKLTRLSDRIAQSNRLSPGGRIDSPLIAGLSNGLITTAPDVDGRIEIHNGWQEARFRFTLVVEESARLGGSVIYHYHGYSEYFDVSHDDSVDPNMVFFLNDYIKIIRTENANGTISDRIVETKTLLDGGRLRGSDDLYGLRPSDVFSGLQSSMISGDGGYGYSNLKDPRVILNHATATNNRSSGTPSVYLAGILDRYRSAKSFADHGNGNENVLDRAISMAHEPSVSEICFIRQLSNIVGTTSMATSFTINDLLQMDETFDDRVHYTEVDDLYMLSSHRGDFADWDDRSYDTRIAAVIANAVPGMMLASGLITFGFTATNMTVDERNLVEMTMPGITASTHSRHTAYNNFLQRFEVEIMPDITENGEIGLMVNVLADTTNEISIQITVEGGHPKEWRFPCFADGLTSPTVTRRQDNFRNLISGVEEILNHADIDTSLDIGAEAYMARDNYEEPSFSLRKV